MPDPIIECERCRRKYQVPAQHSGKAFRCRNCDHIIPIPRMEDSNIVAPEDVSIVDDDERWQETEVEQPTRRPAVSARERRRERTSRVLQNAAAEDKSAARLKHLLVGVFSAVATVAVILGVQVFTGSSGENDDAIAAVDALSKGANGKTDAPVSATPE